MSRPILCSAYSALPRTWYCTWYNTLPAWPTGATICVCVYALKALRTGNVRQALLSAANNDESYEGARPCDPAFLSCLSICLSICLHVYTVYLRTYAGMQVRRFNRHAHTHTMQLRKYACTPARMYANSDVWCVVKIKNKTMHYTLFHLCFVL